MALNIPPQGNISLLHIKHLFTFSVLFYLESLSCALLFLLVSFGLLSCGLNKLIVGACFQPNFFSLSFLQDNVHEDNLSSELYPVPQATRGSPILQTDKAGAFLLDLHNFPDLSKADISKQNPNIQVKQICLVTPLFSVS